MTEHVLDDELLAAFLDGTLASAERERVLRVIAERPEEYARFVEAAEILAAVHDEESAGVIPITSRLSRRWKGKLFLAVPFLAVAGLAGMVVISSPPGPDDAIEAIHYAPGAPFTGAGVISARLGAEWDDPGWSVTRGGSASDLSPGTAARIGARVAQLEFAAKAGDSVAYAQVLIRLHALLATAPGSSPMLARLRLLPLHASRERATVAGQLRLVIGKTAEYDAGALLETLRLALSSGSTSEAGRGEWHRTLVATLRAMEQAPPSSELQPLIAQMRSLTKAAAYDTAQLRTSVESAINALAQ